MNDDHFEIIAGQSPPKTAWQTLATSKVNLTQYSKLIAQMLVLGGYEASPEDVLVVLTGIEAVATLATVIFRTWFSSAGGAL